VDRVDPMEFLESHLDFLLRHLLAVVFVGFLVEAAGVPFPRRLLLLSPRPWPGGRNSSSGSSRRVRRAR
jgi:hypothetical protein